MVADVLNRIRRLGPVRIDPYRSFGPPSALRFTGRVLANPPITPAEPGDTTARSVVRMAERFVTREIEGEPVTVVVGHHRGESVTDSEGFFDITLDVRDLGIEAGGWINAAGWLPDRAHDEPWELPSLVVDRTTTRLVISDVDDTLLSNGAGNTARTVIQTLAGTAHTRQPIAGAPELYQRLATTGPSSEPCPVFYVSSSPWNIFDFLTAFMDLHRFPRGPLLLRDLGLNRATFGGAHGSHKVNGIDTILAAAPNAEVVLIGDTSQQDAGAFVTTITDHPGRVRAAYLRDVGDDDKAAAIETLIEADPQLDGVMSVVSELPAIATDLERRGWLRTGTGGRGSGRRLSPGSN